MRRIAEEQATRLHDALAYSRGDIAFQRTVARAAGNVGIELILNSIARFPEEQPNLVAQIYDRRDDSVAFYAVAIELIRSGDATAARQLVPPALKAFDDEWLHRHGYRPVTGVRTTSAHTPAAEPSVVSTETTKKRDDKRDAREAGSTGRRTTTTKKSTRGR
jgi:hypothetical protein